MRLEVWRSLEKDRLGWWRVEDAVRSYRRIL